MARAMTNDLDCLAARLHGRCSRLAEGDRLDALCRLRDLSELGGAICPSAEFRGAADFQRRVVQDFALELGGMLKHLGAGGGDLLAWMQVRFQVENLKVLVRGFASHTPREELLEHMVLLPSERAPDTTAMAAAGSWEAFVE